MSLQDSKALAGWEARGHSGVVFDPNPPQGALCVTWLIAFTTSRVHIGDVSLRG